MQRAGVIAALILLSSCASNPVGWGGRYQVIRAGDQSITIEYDRVMSSYQEILEVAQTYCNKSGKKAVPVVEDDRSKEKGLIPVYTFRCE